MEQKGFYCRMHGEKRFIFIRACTEGRVFYSTSTVEADGSKTMLVTNCCLSEDSFSRRFSLGGKF